MNKQTDSVSLARNCDITEVMNTTLSVQNNFQDEVNKASIYIYPIIITLTVITNVLNICVLCRRNLRSLSCTHYFIAFALTNLLYICEVPVMMLLRIRIDFAVTSSPLGCRFQTFVIFILPLISSMMLVLASIDRFTASSLTIRVHNINQVRVAQQVIIITVIVTIIYITPFMFIYYFDSTVNQCVPSSSTIAGIYLSSRIVLLYILIPLAMAVFGFLTMHNIRVQRGRIIPIGLNPQRLNRHRLNERQLRRMLILQISAYLIFSIPSGVGYTLVTFVTSMNTIFMIQLRIIFNLWQQTIYFLSFFLYIFSSQTYRRELYRMFNFQD